MLDPGGGWPPSSGAVEANASHRPSPLRLGRMLSPRSGWAPPELTLARLIAPLATCTR